MLVNCGWQRAATLVILSLAGVAASASRSPQAFAENSTQRISERPVLLAHYMPWYAAKPTSAVWGWHWTMNHFRPDAFENGRRSIASKLYPAIGPYDSADPLVVDYHLLLMKLAGIDGLVIDWYGRERLHDYAQLHRNTQRLVARAGELGLKVAVCYEDRTIKELVKSGRVPAEGRAAQAAKEIEWLVENWFPLDHYVKVEGKPLLLSFGTANLTDAEWSAALQMISAPIAYVSQKQGRSAAIGGFDWPAPSRGGIVATEQFYKNASRWRLAIPVAYPRFDDIYEQAKLHPSYGNIPDDAGATFRKTLEAALTSSAPIVQIATWNDWGEGTVIEPSAEFGTRDLEVLQKARKQHVEPSFQFGKDDLKIPELLLEARRQAASAGEAAVLEELVLEVAKGRCDKVRAELAAAKKE